MTRDELLAKAVDQLGVRRVFGEPIERDGILVIPVAVAAGGGGGGSGCGPNDEGSGSGGGFGGFVRAIGVYVIREGQVRFVPAVDAVALAGIVWLVARTLTRAAQRRLPSR